MLRDFEYNVDIECRTLFKSGDFHKTPYDSSAPAADLHFQIINVGNDNAVLHRILTREEYLWNAGYERIVGLRDMYSRAYKEESRSIDDLVTQEFIQGANKTIKKRARSPEKIVMCFAIMEIEAWFLAMYDVFKKLDRRLTVEYIEEHMGVDLKNVDPETEFFHPTNQVEEIFQLAGQSYNKRKNEIEALVGHLTKTDFGRLLESNKCNSYNLFYNALQDP